MELIPGLPDDLARQCFFRVHCSQLSALSSLSKAWKSELQSLEFWRHRKQLCNNKQLILLKCWKDSSIYTLVILEPETSIWYELPPIPEFPTGVPADFKFVTASFKWGFVVMGAHYFYRDCDDVISYDDISFCNKVFVYDYLSATWERGADMPEEQLAVYNCTSDRDRMIYVLCKRENDMEDHTECIRVYDVLKDEWSTSRIDARKHGGDCSAGSMRGMIYQSGKIHFFDHWVQGGHDTDLRVIDVSTWKWNRPEYFLGVYDHNNICLSDDGVWYSCRRLFGALATRNDGTWQKFGQAPYDTEEEMFEFMITWKSKLMVILQSRNDSDSEPRRFLVLDLKNHKWTTLHTATVFTGAKVEASCYLQI